MVSFRYPFQLPITTGGELASPDLSFAVSLGLSDSLESEFTMWRWSDLVEPKLIGGVEHFFMTTYEGWLVCSQ
jgi:hypothetical protein